MNTNNSLAFILSGVLPLTHQENGCKQGGFILDKRKAPLRKVIKEYVGANSQMYVKLECGHEIRTPIDITGGYYHAERRRCWKCTKEKEE